jgi:hypothetical protein
MTRYAETFNINRRVYGIERLADGRLRCWVGGCGIGVADSMDEARQILHGYAISEATALVGSATEQLTRAREALVLLGADHFNLGRFRV